MVRVVSELLGRHRERAELDRAISGLGKGRSAALVIRGEAGIGKSVLLDYAADQAAGHCVTRATGVESEMELRLCRAATVVRPIPWPAQRSARTATRSAESCIRVGHRSTAGRLPRGDGDTESVCGRG